MESKSSEAVRAVMTELFKEYGLPKVIRSDNGTPFSSPNGLLSLTCLSAWWITLGITPDRTDKGTPGQNGSLERMHADIAREIQGQIKGGRKANLDVAYRREGKQYYIESKFLEPYYSGNEHNTESYFKKEYYDVPDNDKDAWYTLLLDAQNYKIYNFSQICRHLMAIWRKHKEDKQLKIVFQSVIWKMTDKFIENIDNEEDKEILRSRIIVIDKEAKSAKSRIDKFLADIDWKNITFESVYYNDILEDISFSKYCSEFKQRYFL